MSVSEKKQKSKEKTSKLLLQTVAIQLARGAKQLRENIERYLNTPQMPASIFLLSEFERLKLLGAVTDLTDFTDSWSQISVFTVLFSRYLEPTLLVNETSLSFVQTYIPALQNELEAILTPDTVALLQEEYHNQVLLHLYETFLAHYDPVARKRLGVWYTPPCVVRFMVEATQYLLACEWSVVYAQEHIRMIEPAAGTGAFLAETVRMLTVQNAWRRTELHGFEISWPTYCIAQLNSALAYYGAGGTAAMPVQLHLTNSLLAPHPKIDASVKGITIVMGNPPYNRGSVNNSAWITKLVKKYKPYKRSNTGKKLDEVNIVALSDDYVKFMALAQYYVECSGEGIVAFITNKGYLDGIIHRQMRYELLSCFDAIYILNLHGDSRYSAKTPSGEKDENIFNIKTGVCISLLVKHKQSQGGLAKVYYHEVYGLRTAKEDFLNSYTFQDVPWQELSVRTPHYYFVPKDFAQQEEYMRGFGIQELFDVYSTAVETQRDQLAVQWKPEDFTPLIADATRLSEDEFRQKHNVGADGRDWKLGLALKTLQNTADIPLIALDYYPFDQRYMLYSDRRGLVAYPRFKKLGCMLAANNIALISLRTVKGASVYQHCLVSRHLVDRVFFVGNTTVFPLYRLRKDAVYTPEQIVAGACPPLETNFNADILEKIEKRLGAKIDTQELFDYIYAVLNAPNYCKRYEAFLKIDFPRLPYPTDRVSYGELAAIGSRLRELHLMKGSKDWLLQTSFPVAGHNRVQKIQYAKNRVYINTKQYFEGINAEVWQVLTGGYQPAKKWLKERIGRTLDANDVIHYQRIIYVLEQTIKIQHTELNRFFLGK